MLKPFSTATCPEVQDVVTRIQDRSSPNFQLYSATDMFMSYKLIRVVPTCFGQSNAIARHSVILPPFTVQILCLFSPKQLADLQKLAWPRVPSLSPYCLKCKLGQLRSVHALRKSSCSEFPWFSKSNVRVYDLSNSIPCLRFLSDREIYSSASFLFIFASASNRQCSLLVRRFALADSCAYPHTYSHKAMGTNPSRTPFSPGFRSVIIRSRDA
jgi:hypothetical protein